MVKWLKSYACRADYVVSVLVNGDRCELVFYILWVLGDGLGNDECVNFMCDVEEMMYLVEMF